MPRDPTPYFSFDKPSRGEDWLSSWDELVDALDDHLWNEGPVSDRPTDPPTGSWYAATDEQIFYRYDGNTWIEWGGVNASGGGGGGGTDVPATVTRAPNLNLEGTELTNGDSIIQRVPIRDGETLTVYAWGVVDQSDSAPSGLLVELRDPSDSVVADANTRWQTDTAGLASYSNSSGSMEVAMLAVTNQTGSDYSASNDESVSARFGYEVN